MKNMRIYLGSLLAVAALAMPMASYAKATPQDDHEQRYYDRDHKDYHKWDDREDRAWDKFLEEKHRVKHAFREAKRKEQNEYWSWRHEHPDHD